jgi:predicted transcriptional regulator
MKLHQIVKELGLEVKSRVSNLDKEVSGGYASDLLSDVIANAKKGNVWITLQIHQNIVGVATLKELTGIIIVNGREPEKETLRKANEENIPIMITELPAFEIVGKLYRMLGGC